MIERKEQVTVKVGSATKEIVARKTVKGSIQLFYADKPFYMFVTDRRSINTVIKALTELKEAIDDR